MKLKPTWMLASAIAMAFGGTAVTASADVLDEALGGDNAPKKEAAPAPPGAPPEVKLTRPKMPDLVSPDAAKTVDDQDLMNKLTGKSDVEGGEAKGAKEKMDEVMERMGQAETRLAQHRDAGLVTQETQRRIVTDLDVMIEYLKEQQKKGGGKSKEPKPGEKQEKSQSKGQQQGPGQPGGNQAAQDSQMRPGSAQAPQANDTDIHQTGTNWGDLPPRDRDLVAHGAREHYLPEYKEMIKKYYEALAEIGKASRGR